MLQYEYNTYYGSSLVLILGRFSSECLVEVLAPLEALPVLLPGIILSADSYAGGGVS